VLDANQQYFYIQNQTDGSTSNYSVNIISVHNSLINFFLLTSDGTNDSFWGDESTEYLGANYLLSLYMVPPNLNISSPIPYGSTQNSSDVTYLHIQKILNISVCGVTREVVFANTSTTNSYTVQEWDRATGITVYYVSFGVSVEGRVLIHSNKLAAYGSTSQYFFARPTIHDNFAPGVLYLTQGEGGQINWTPYGDFPADYFIYLDSQLVYVDSWTSGSEITYSVPTNLDVGNHTIEIIVCNSAGLRADDSERIVMQSAPPWTFYYILSFVDIAVCVVLFGVYLRKRSEWKSVTR
jgi:hypothetical protein